MDTNKSEQPITIRFPQDLLEALRQSAKEHRRSLNGEVIFALEGYIAKRKPKKKE